MLNHFKAIATCLMFGGAMLSNAYGMDGSNSNFTQDGSGVEDLINRGDTKGVRDFSKRPGNEDPAKFGLKGTWAQIISDMHHKLQEARDVKSLMSLNSYIADGNVEAVMKFSQEPGHEDSSKFGYSSWREAIVKADDQIYKKHKEAVNLSAKKAKDKQTSEKAWEEAKNGLYGGKNNDAQSHDSRHEGRRQYY